MVQAALRSEMFTRKFPFSSDVIRSADELEAEIPGECYRFWIIADSPYGPANLVQV